MMQKSRFFLALLFVSLSFVLIPATANAGLWDVPVAPGESFRWVFVTSGARHAASSSINTYNDFVNAAADAAGTTITGVVGKSSIADIGWKAIASTATIDAINNIGSSPAGIYTPLGTLVANGTTDMFDGSLRAPISITETGAASVGWVWSGSRADGRAKSGHTPGTTWITVGHNYYIDYQWLDKGYELAGNIKPFYAISEELTVIPVPGALMLAAMGLLSSTLGLKRLRRKR